VAFDSPAEPSRHHFDGLRRVDHLDSGLQQGSERLPDPCGIRMHGPVSKNRNNFHTVRAWAILTICSSSAGVAITALATRGGHW
jgi:hypothetical protein